jgi:hypothetical protein
MKKMKAKYTLSILTIAYVLSGNIQAKSGVEHQVHVGGPDASSLCEEGDQTCDKNFSLTALVMSNGKIVGNYVDRFAGDSKGFMAKIDCVSINDNKAWISGIIKNGEYLADIDAIGRRVATLVVDNGKNIESPFDQISFSFLVADSHDCSNQPDWPVFDMPKGQVSIR